MEQIIKDSCSDTIDAKCLQEGYYLFTSKAQVLLPRTWDKFVSPGLDVRLSLWPRRCQDDKGKTPIRLIYNRITVDLKWHRARSWPGEALVILLRYTNFMSRKADSRCSGWKNC